ncbi:helix-turn-helix transcriptional regulator [Sphingobium sp. EM0848]|uniref:helix-turn-helix transcriptional regulator n=1 Tax=Sphingobium sp. EM0848 TaxID=2743473 RepID=UPI00159C1472|nr:LuxR C-terminal-related transcriptional regulator [Sphingobium sp. EM0848]
MFACDVMESPVDAEKSVREALEPILGDLRNATELSEAEKVLDAVAAVLDLPLTFWVLDTSHPYQIPEMDRYARARGWPDELLSLWWDRHAALKMPVYIRCRFTDLPFVVSLQEKRRRQPYQDSPEQRQVTALIRDMGVSTLLVVPIHLPKGRVAMMVLAGGAKDSSFKALIQSVEGDLLAIGHRFMRIAGQSVGGDADDQDERSHLTPREWDCARTLAQGYREAEIAQLMGISKVTVRFHLDNVVQKFGCKTRAQAMALLGQLGLLGPVGA